MIDPMPVIPVTAEGHVWTGREHASWCLDEAMTVDMQQCRAFGTIWFWPPLTIRVAEGGVEQKTPGR